MPKYFSQVGLSCHYRGAVEVEAENVEEALQKINGEINYCIGTAHGKLRPYFTLKADTGSNFVFNLMNSEYHLLTEGWEEGKGDD